MTIPVPLAVWARSVGINPKTAYAMYREHRMPETVRTLEFTGLKGRKRVMVEPVPREERDIARALERIEAKLDDAIQLLAAQMHAAQLPEEPIEHKETA